MRTIIFTRAYRFNGHARKVGNITRVRDEIAEALIYIGAAANYTGEFPPRQKIKISLRDLKTHT